MPTTAGRWAVRRCSGSVSRTLLHDQTAIDRHGVAGDERGRVRAQPHHGFGDFLGLAGPANRMDGDKAFHHAWITARQTLDHGGFDDPRAHGVDPNTGLGVFQGGGFAQADHAVLAGHIGRHARSADQAGSRGGVDDGSAALLEHGRDFILHAQPHPGQIDPNNAVPVRLGVLGRIADRPLNAGIIMGTVEPAIGVESKADHGLDFGRPGHVGFDAAGLAARFLDESHRLLGLVFNHVGDHDLRPFPGKGQRRGSADPGAAAGDQRDFSAQ